MDRKVYYVFCRDCGGDTAMHSLSSRCPFCGATQGSLQVITDSDESMSPEQLLCELEKVRAEWAKSSGKKVASRKKRSFWRRIG
jgi:hypothetical protein